MPVLSKTLAPKSKTMLPEGMTQREALGEVVVFLRLTMKADNAPWTARVAAARTLADLYREHDTSQMNVDQLRLVQNTLNVMSNGTPPLKGELPDSGK